MEQDTGEHLDATTGDMDKLKLLYEESRAMHYRLIERMDYTSESCLKGMTITPIIIGLITYLVAFPIDVDSEPERITNIVVHLIFFI